MVLQLHDVNVAPCVVRSNRSWMSSPFAVEASKQNLKRCQPRLAIRFSWSFFVQLTPRARFGLCKASRYHATAICLEPSCLLFFSAEYIEGGTLEAILDIAVALSENRTRLIMAELACAVGHIHSLGILHRDIKV